MSYNYAAKIGKILEAAEGADRSAERYEEAGDAEHAAEFREQAKNFRLKAEQLMRDYRISEEEAIAKDQFSIVPIKVEITLMERKAYDNPLGRHYVSLFSEIARHAGIMFVAKYVWGVWGEDDSSKVVAAAYGYESDLRLVEFLWTAARMAFLTRIDASVNPELSDQENAYYMRNSGMRRNEVAKLLWGAALNDGVAHGRVQKLYLAECAARGERPRVAGRGVQVDVYREAYATGFVREFGWRLREARDAADSVGGSLELPGRKERVAEAFYADYPGRRPMSEEERAARFAAVDAEGECEACKRTTSKTGRCKAHRPINITEADRRAYYRKYESPEALAGQRAGTQAAKAVNIARSSERQQRTDAAPERTALGA